MTLRFSFEIRNHPAAGGSGIAQALATRSERRQTIDRFAFNVYWQGGNACDFDK
jgi:hypothetical protein